MSDAIINIDVAAWVERAKNDPVAYRQRQAAEILLNAIAMITPFNDKLYLKGGTLMGLAYGSPRQTTDIDFTADLAVCADIDETIRSLLDRTFPRAAAVLGYDDFVVKVNSIKRRPRQSNFETARFPALALKVGYAIRGSRQESALREGRCPHPIHVDISFNEPTHTIQILRLTDGKTLRAYSLIDLIAEKYRAMLQQVPRNRSRRQDVYDIYLLIEHEQINDDNRRRILDAFLEKSRSRDLEPDRDALDNPEIKHRCSKEWDTLQLELGDVPNFETCFTRVRGFYRALPWAVTP